MLDVYEELRKYIYATNIGKKRFDALVHRLELRSLRRRELARKLLEDIRSLPSFLEFKRIYDQLPQEIWENYRILSPRGDLIEQKLLKEASEKLRRDWVELYRTYVNDSIKEKSEQNSRRIESRSPGSRADETDCRYG